MRRIDVKIADGIRNQRNVTFSYSYIELHDTHVNVCFSFQADQYIDSDDPKVGDETRYYTTHVTILKKWCNSVQADYNDKEDVWIIQIGGNFNELTLLVDTQAYAMELLDIIKNYLLSRPPLWKRIFNLFTSKQPL